MSYGKEIIYHYTSIVNLYGIVGSKCLKFNKFSDANDPREWYSRSEYRYISFTTNRIIGGWQNPLMWYLYGKNYEGVCIGFDKNKLLRLNSDIMIAHFPIEYRASLPNAFDKGLEPMKYKLLSWAGENEYRFATNDKTAKLKIDLDCIEKVYFMNQESTKPLNPDLEAILTIGLNDKLTNIAICEGEITEAPLQHCNGKSHFAVCGKVYAPLTGEESLKEDEIYARCAELHNRFTNKPCINCHESPSPTTRQPLLAPV